MQIQKKKKAISTHFSFKTSMIHRDPVEGQYSLTSSKRSLWDEEGSNTNCKCCCEFKEPESKRKKKEKSQASTET